MLPAPVIKEEKMLKIVFVICPECGYEQTHDAFYGIKRCEYCDFLIFYKGPEG